MSYRNAASLQLIPVWYCRQNRLNGYDLGYRHTQAHRQPCSDDKDPVVTLGAVAAARNKNYSVFYGAGDLPTKQIWCSYHERWSGRLAGLGGGGGRIRRRNPPEILGMKNKIK
jgi:hypothetical protein